MRYLGLLIVLGAFCALSAPTQGHAADYGLTAPRQAAPAKVARVTVRASQRQRVALYEDCRTGWWMCRCDGTERRPVWVTRCR